MWRLSESISIKPLAKDRFRVCQNKTGKTLMVSTFVKDILLNIGGGYDENDVLSRLRQDYAFSSDSAAKVKLTAALNLLLSKGLVGSSKDLGHNRVVTRERDEGIDRVVILVTNTCNLKCRHCDADSQTDAKARRNELTTSEIAGLLAELDQAGVLNLVITGGEPFLRKDILELLELANRLGFITKVFTNGTLISRSTAEALAEMEFIRVQVGLDGVYGNTHDTFRGVRGAFRKSIEGIRRLVESGMPISVGTVIHSGNLEQMKKFPRFLNGIGVNEWVVSTVMPIGRAVGEPDIFLSDEQFKTFMRTYLDMIADSVNTGLRISSPAFDWELINNVQNRPVDNIGRKCKPFRLSLTILPDGSITPCERLTFLVLGNIRKGRILDYVRDVERIRRLRDSIEDVSPECDNCRYVSICGRGCPGVMLSHKSMDGDSRYVDPISCRFFDLCLDYFLDKVPKAAAACFHEMLEESREIGIGDDGCG